MKRTDKRLKNTGDINKRPAGKAHINKIQTDQSGINRTQMWNFIYLLQLPLGGKPGEKEICDVDWELMYRLCRKHNVAALGYRAADSYKGTARIPAALHKKWKQDSDQSTMQCLYQQAAQEELEDAFQQNQISVIFLKGAVLRELYPSPDLRSMADIDMLIHEEDAARVGNLMKKLQYKVYAQGSRNEDVYCREPGITVEVHRQLFWKKHTWNEYFRTVWERSTDKTDSPYIKSMNIQDFYIHLLGHLIHHMENGGLGIKAFLDLKLFYQKYQGQLSQTEMKKLLEKFHFARFEENIRKLLKYWESGETNEFLEEWTEFIVGCGAYGNADNFIIRNAALNENVPGGSRKQKSRYIWRRLFPAYREMCQMYPGAEKGLYTYPWYWLRRFWKNGVLRYPAIRRELQKVQELDEKKIDKLNELYKKTGIPRRNKS